jgi:Flp pilus assembly pilin Flp
MSVAQYRPQRPERRLLPLLERLCRDDDGQDLVEYALMAAFIATAGMVVLNALGPTIATTFASWSDPTVGAPSLWNPPEPPAGAGS